MNNSGKLKSQAFIHLVSMSLLSIDYAANKSIKSVTVHLNVC